MKKTHNIIILITLLLGSCGPDFLEEKPRKSLLVPTSLQDFQALLDNGFQLMNVVPYHSILADGDFAITDALLASESDLNRNAYVWGELVVPTMPGWDTPYRQVFTCNVVLDGLAKTERQTAGPELDAIKGAALFQRAAAFFFLAQQFAPAYDASAANSGAGIVLPLTADVNQKLPRSTVKEAYDQIKADLLEAASLLPVRAAFLSRPGKAAAHAMLARVLLAMQDYPAALEHAQAGLDIQGGLLDYNTITPGQAASLPLPFLQSNPEVILFSEIRLFLLTNPAVSVDSLLMQTYQQGDLRRELFFTAGQNFKGSYTGTLYLFAGLATDELYLIKAECQIRLDSRVEGLATLNVLLKHRWYKSRFKEVSAQTDPQALEMVLSERRKQLLGRGTRWTDLKRLNLDPQTAVTLTRKVDGEVLTLAPGSVRYQFKIPEDELSFGVVTQNP
jgi:hypothetical protein